MTQHETPMKIPIKLLSPAAKVPVRAKPGDAAYDLFAAYDALIVPGGRALVKTGISIAIPHGYYGRIAPRSGLAIKRGVDVLGGVIDSGFSGEVGVILAIMTEGDPEDDETVAFHVKAGDRIAQMIIEKCHEVDWEVVDKLPETARGQDGFGSTDERLITTNGAGGASELSGDAQVECMRRDALGLPFDLKACNEVARRKLAPVKVVAGKWYGAARPGDGGKPSSDTPFNPLDHEQCK